MAAKSKILVVEDEAEFAELLKMRLESVGYEAVIACDGMEGLEKANKERPDLILLDIMMPKVDGLTMLKRLRAEEPTSKIPVILLTAKGQMDSINEAQRYGATDYIIKPYEWSDLLKFIKRYLAIYE